MLSEFSLSLLNPYFFFKACDRVTVFLSIDDLKSVNDWFFRMGFSFVYIFDKLASDT